MNFKNLIVDLDNTLYGYEVPHNTALSKVFERFSTQFDIDLKTTEETFRSARLKTHLELPNRAASHNRLLYFQKMLELNGLNGMKYALELYNCYWGTFLDHMTLFDTVIAYLEKQRSNGARVCILTDLTADIQFRKIEKLGLFDHIDFLVTSEEVGVEKPHPYMFSRALQKLACDASDTVMIGDSWQKDIVGANAMGIQSIWINHAKEQRILTNNIREVSRFEEISTDEK